MPQTGEPSWGFVGVEHFCGWMGLAAWRIPNMATRFIEEVDPTSDQSISDILTALKNMVSRGAIPLIADGDTGSVHYYDRFNGAARKVVNTDEAQTLTNKTLTAPTISAPVVTGNPTGIVKVAGGVITELTGDGAYSISVTLPAGAVIIDILVTGVALWTAGTSATLIVGDSVDDDGFITACDVKSAPAVGSTFSLFSEAAMGTVDGAYLNTDSIVGPTSTNFGLYYADGSTIKAKVTKSGSGTAGRTAFHVVYALPETVAQVVV
jgi:hypothetical protein